MSKRPAVYPALRLALSPEPRRRAKCDCDVKLHLPEALYDDLARQARADSRAVSEYIRVVLERYLYGTLGAQHG
ncbi:MAG: hypothetical protein P9F19_15810 [Candidatus Contendobacter sp.]|nr:hypothetical protein [Candidatus Contendobacter sp.]MDG4558837.1 hypothetical protein [Candidatus Contendobacter sp.]